MASLKTARTLNYGVRSRKFSTTAYRYQDNEDSNNNMSNYETLIKQKENEITTNNTNLNNLKEEQEKKSEELKKNLLKIKSFCSWRIKATVEREMGRFRSYFNTYKNTIGKLNPDSETNTVDTEYLTKYTLKTEKYLKDKLEENKVIKENTDKYPALSDTTSQNLLALVNEEKEIHEKYKNLHTEQLKAIKDYNDLCFLRTQHPGVVPINDSSNSSNSDKVSTASNNQNINSKQLPEPILSDSTPKTSTDNNMLSSLNSSVKQILFGRKHNVENKSNKSPLDYVIEKQAQDSYDPTDDIE